MIAILEDDKSIRDLLLYTLVNSGYEAVGFSSSDEFFPYLETNTPQLLLLDLMLPGLDGLGVLEKLKKKESTKDILVIMLTAKDTEYDKIVGLDKGADDYVTKPFSVLELMSRIKALLRRNTTKVEEKILKYKLLRLDEEGHDVFLSDSKLDMTLKEFNTLKLLLSKKGRVVSRDELLNSVWGYDYYGETRTVDVHIRTIRAKLGECGNYVETIRGIGYKIGGNDD